MGRLALCMAGFLLAWVVAEAQTYSTPPPSPTYSTPPPSSTLPKKQPPSLPPKKKHSPPPPPPKKHTPPPPPPKKRTPPPPPKKKQSPPPPPPKKHTPPPPPPKKRTPPPPPTYYTPPVVASPPPPPTPTWPSPPPPPPTVVPNPTTPAWPSPPPTVPSPAIPWPSPPPATTPTWPSPPPPPPPTVVPTPATPAWPSPPPTVPSPATPWPSPPPPASAVAAKKVRCKNKAYSTCYFREFTCPVDCPSTCEVDCHTCSPVCNCNKPGAICQDPRFIGADGLTFYFHGKKDRDFCLVTDPNLHINAHFIGKRNANMGRDFTWVQSLGILFDNHHIYIGARKTATWNDASDRLSLSFDGLPIDLIESEGSTWESSSNGITITRSKATNAVEIEVENKFKIKATVVPITEKESVVHNYGITPEDCFAHLDLRFKFYSLSGEVNGVLGQTYGRNYVSKVKMGILMPVVGGERKFSTSNLFATDCSVSRFIGGNVINDEDDDNEDANSFGDLNCGTGINGRGVICKR